MLKLDTSSFWDDIEKISLSHSSKYILVCADNFLKNSVINEKELKCIKCWYGDVKDYLLNINPYKNTFTFQSKINKLIDYFESTRFSGFASYIFLEVPEEMYVYMELQETIGGKK